MATLSDSAAQITITAKDNASATLAAVSGQVAAIGDTASKQGVSLSQFGSALGSIGMGLTASVTAPIIGGLTLAVKSAMDFNAQMLLIQTQAGASAQEVQSMSTAILGMAGSVAQAPMDLSKGLYEVESSGFSGAAALSILQSAAEGATVGQSDLQTTTSALTSVMASNLKGVTDANSAISQMNGIVGAGKMTMTDLVGAIGTGILPMLSQAGMSFSDFGTAIDTMTTKGVSATDAATKLNASLKAIVAPTPAAIKALGDMGLSQFQLADDLKTKGLMPTLEDLQTHLKDSGLTADQQTAEISAAFGGIKGSETIVGLLNGLGQMPAMEATAAQSAKNFGADFKASMEDPATRAKAAQANLQSTLIQLGNTVMPVVGEVLQDVSKYAQELASWWEKLSPASQDFALKIAVVAAAIGPVLLGVKAAIGLFQDLSTAVEFLAANPIVLLVAAVAAVVVWFATSKKGMEDIKATLTDLKQWWDGNSESIKIVRDVLTVLESAVQGVWAVIANQLLPSITNLWNTVKPWLIPTLETLGAVLAGVVAVGIFLVVDALKVIFTGISDVTNNFAQFIKGLEQIFSGNFSEGFKNLGGAILNGLLEPVKLVIDGFNTLIQGADKLPGIHIPQIPQIPAFAGGVNNFGGGMALVGENGPELVNLPGGSSVIPNSQIGSSSSSSNSVTVVIQGGVFLDNNTVNKLAQAVQTAVGRNTQWVRNGAF